jgi:hypothetical protein
LQLGDLACRRSGASFVPTAIGAKERHAIAWALETTAEPPAAQRRSAPRKKCTRIFTHPIDLL